MPYFFKTQYAYCDDKVEYFEVKIYTSYTPSDNLIINSFDELKRQNIQVQNEIDFNNEKLIITPIEFQFRDSISFSKENSEIDVTENINVLAGYGCPRHGAIQRPKSITLVAFKMPKSVKVNFIIKYDTKSICQIFHSNDLIGIKLPGFKLRVNEVLSHLSSNSKPLALNAILNDIIKPQLFAGGSLNIEGIEEGNEWIQKNIGSEYIRIVRYALDLGANPSQADKERRIQFNGVSTSLMFRAQDSKIRKLLAAKGAEFDIDENFLIKAVKDPNSILNFAKKSYFPSDYDAIVSSILNAQKRNSQLVQGKFITSPLSKKKLHQILRLIFSRFSTKKLQPIEKIGIESSLTEAAFEYHDNELLQILVDFQMEVNSNAIYLKGLKYKESMDVILSKFIKNEAKRDILIKYFNDIRVTDISSEENKIIELYKRASQLNILHPSDQPLLSKSSDPRVLRFFINSVFGSTIDNSLLVDNIVKINNVENQSLIKLLISKKVNLNITDKNGRPIFLRILYLEDCKLSLEFTKIFIENGVALNYLENYYKNVFYGYPALAKCFDSQKLLIKSGAPQEGLITQLSKLIGLNGLRNQEVIQLIMNGLDVNKVEDGKTLLYYAVYEDNIEIAKALLEQKAFREPKGLNIGRKIEDFARSVSMKELLAKFPDSN